jgi:tRNA(Arg) A34 adenosine deaminase TadA
MPRPADFSFSVPDWVADINASNIVLPDLDARVAFVIEASQRNANSGGGPFAAGVFETGSGRLIALGVNLVVVEKCCVLHGEMVALMLAQRRLGAYDFGRSGLDLELVSSTEPCAMCYGAVPWSGVKRLICAASDADARAAGFDEGHKAADWRQALEQRGIAVVTDIGRAQAAAVLAKYRDDGHEIYNGKR